MFDIGFWELSLIAVIALLILGPERLPRAARQAGLWAGKLKKMVSEVKSNINEELRMEDLNALKQAGQDLKDDLQSTQKELGSVEQEMKRSVEEISSAAGSVDIASAINESSPIARDDAAGSRASATDAAGGGKAPQNVAPGPAPKTASVNSVEQAAAPAEKKDKSGKQKKAGAAAKGKSGSKEKKPKKSGKKAE